jgi:glycosyltransferase involved in cell wall biosynthesis
MRKRVSVIIPTLACSERGDQLLAAIKSIQMSVDADLVKIIVCVNGRGWNKDVVGKLRQMNDIDLHFQREQSLPKALAFGRSLVSTEFFCFLDDDDELLPLSIATRVRALDERHEVDLAVTNGYNQANGEFRLRYPALPSKDADTFASLLDRNWLASCGALYRSASVGLDYFKEGYAYREWIWLAFKLLMDNRKVVFIDSPLYVVNYSEFSLSRSAAYGKADALLHQKMLDMAPPRRIKKLIQARISRAAHDLSDDALRRGEIWGALNLHLKSLVLPGGLEHLSYSRHLLLTCLAFLVPRVS